MDKKLVRLIPALFVIWLNSSAVWGKRPNILLIFADDLGWSDLGCYGSERFETPHLDRLSAGGMRFTQGYAAAPICSASRAALLTGNSSARNRFEFVVKDAPGSQKVPAPLLAPPFTINLSRDAETIAESLAKVGYRTGFFGKWHLNAHHKRYLGWSPTHGPMTQGFDTAVEDFGSHPYSYWRKGKLARSFLELPAGRYPDDGVTRRAIEFLKAKHDKPFFLMVSHFFVHDPNHTRVKWRYDKYIKTVPDSSRRETLAHYGSMVSTLDHHVGELLAALKATGQRDSTVVVFTSDNGGHPNYAGNAPLRGSKWNLYEGGVRVPFIVRWPGITAPGTTCKTPVWSPDLFPTFAEIGGSDSSSARDGTSMVSMIRDSGSGLPQRPMVWHFPYYHPERRYPQRRDEIGVDDGETSKTKPQTAIRVGDWKLIHFFENSVDELYNVERDPSESEDLSQRHPAKTSQLRKQLMDYLSEVNARLPAKNPGYRLGK